MGVTIKSFYHFNYITVQINRIKPYQEIEKDYKIEISIIFSTRRFVSMWPNLFLKQLLNAVVVFLLLKIECRVVRKRKSTNCQYYQNIQCLLPTTTVQKSKQIYENCLTATNQHG